MKSLMPFKLRGEPNSPAKVEIALEKIKNRSFLYWINMNLWGLENQNISPDCPPGNHTAAGWIDTFRLQEKRSRS